MKKYLIRGNRGALALGEARGVRIFGGSISVRNAALFLCLLGALIFDLDEAKAREFVSREAVAKNPIISEGIDPEWQKIAGLDFGNPQKGSTREKFYEEKLFGFPLGDMARELAKLSEDTASYVIAIAKKESQWGRRAPRKDGRDCYNYWGYKGKDEEQVLGYSCFTSKEEAVQKVGARIDSLIQKGLDTPEEFIVWKCGSSCAGHDPKGVAKWISDVKEVIRSLKS